MIRSSILSDKKDELSKCIQLHESLLTELFRVTVGFSRSQEHDPNDINPRNNGEVSFLEANKLSKDRFFDPSTLPTLYSNDIHHATDYIGLSSPTEISTITQDPTAGILHGKDVGSTGISRGEDEAGTVTSLDGTRSFTAISPAIKSPLPLVDGIGAGYPNVQQPVLGEGQAAVPWSETKSLGIEESQRAIHINPYSTAPTAGASLFDSLKGEPQQNPSDTELPVIPSEPLQVSSEGISSMLTSTTRIPSTERSYSDVHQSVPPAKDTLGTRSEVPERGRAIDGQQPVPEVGGTLTNVEEVGRIRNNAIEIQGPVQDAVNVPQSGFPSTPNEQLRLEEAQSLQLSKAPPTIEKDTANHQTGSQSTQPSASISSQFGHDAGEENSVVGVPTSFDENNFRPAVPSNEHFSEHNRRVERPSLGLRDQTLPGMTGNLSKDLTFSRRPPMRIDTGVPPATDQIKSLPSKRTTPGTANPYTPSATATPCKSGPAASQAQSPPERMTTRVSSGALRHKSVSEILGETPKSVAHHGEKGSLERAMNDINREDYAVQSPRSASSTAPPDSAAFKVRLNELREKDRSKLSTIVFARQQPSNLSRYSDSIPAQHSEVIDPALRNKDYLLPLFAAQAATPPHSQPLHSLIASAHKTLTTANHYTDFHEQQDCRMLNKIYQLQYSNRWSLRQLERTVEPDRPATHWDVLLSHMKWMRTDYREERKWKVTAAKTLADVCASWVTSSPERRRSMQIQVRTASSKAGPRPSSALTPELIPSTEDDSSDAAEDDILCDTLAQGSAPAAIFSLPPDMFVFGLEKTPATGKVLQELPLYQPSLEIQDAVLRLNIFLPESAWKKPLVPISKFAEGKMITYEQGPARKRSRYNYQDSDGSEQGHDDGIYSIHVDASITLGPEQEDVALFDPENKHIRDRIHAGHAFRPPSEHIMPSQSFFESRQSSQWTQGEDDELRRLVREYAYNWSLISSCLSSPSIFSSGAERRTPWECFERWVGLEGLPAEMSKTQYFRAYHSRLQAAQRTHEAQQQAIQQHQGHNTPHMPMRRRTTQPFLVDRRKNVKHLHLVDAMRKLAKKRETAVQKQQHVANLAAMRKANEAAQPRPAMHTPQEFSRLKYERECKMQETAKAYRQQILQHQKAALAQKANPQPGPPGGANMMQPGRNSTSGATNGTSPLSNPPLPNGQLPGGSVNQPRPPPIPRLVNGTTSNGILPTNPQGMPHAPMQPHMQMQPRMPPQMGSDNMRVYQEATRVQQEQQRYLQQRQQHHPQATQVGSSASPNMGNPSLMAPSNSAVLASLQSGRSGSPNGAPPPPGSSSSPRMTNSTTQPQPLSSGMVPAVNQISNHMKTRHPQASPEQISKMTTEHLNQYRISHVHAAMQAAAGVSNASAAAANASIAVPGASSALPQQQQQQALMNGNSPMLNPQQYAQMMRSQQSSQQNRNGAGTGVMGANGGSRSATPQNHRSGSAQGGGGPSQSPRPSQAQMAGGQ